ILIWLKGALTPQEVRDKILSNDSEFIAAIVEYLESVTKGEFLSGSLSEVRERADKEMANPDYRNPTENLATKPPSLCRSCKGADCAQCRDVNGWWNSVFKSQTDDILLKSNMHTCSTGLKKNGECKARFPRPLFGETKVDTTTGRIDMKKFEPFLNSFSPLVSYLLRCNTDVTCLHSGTAVKAVVAYVSDYISKHGLKTHVIFDTVRNIYNK
ncbi:hypothetical protein GALMADRAFT_49614, partial [Galerina marginata CBS 339.88]